MARLALCVLACLSVRGARGDEPFAWRGYYFILSRNPGYGLSDYERILDRMRDDRSNVLILWIAGGFPSKRYPETWDYNREHLNVRESFVGKAIDHAHSRGIRVLLGLTPFAYDGVNRFGEKHPELGAADADGKPAVTGGIHSFGRGLCPTKAGAQEFMLGYCLELFDDFYPNADGFFLEHSDYGTCQCKDCGDGKGLRAEWDFVERLSKHVWTRKAGATLMIYPQYATLGVAYDARYIVFLAPHNLRGAEMVKNPKVLWNGYWDAGMSFKALCETAAKEKYAGVIPSMENYMYENPHAFDTRWGPKGSAGWDDLLVRLGRLSFREYTANPKLDDAGWRKAVAGEFFDGSTTAVVSAIDDLLALHGLLNHWSGWTWRAGVMEIPKEPLRLDALEAKPREVLEKQTLPALRAIKAIRDRSKIREAETSGIASRKTAGEMFKICDWVLAEWRRKLPAGLLD